MNIAIIGGGYIGVVMACGLVARGLEITIIETNPDKINSFKLGKSGINEPGVDALFQKGIQAGHITFKDNIQHIGEPEAVLVTVGTPLSSAGKFDISGLELVFHELSQILIKQTLIILKSTVEPGTTKKLLKKFFKNSEHSISYCPERLSEGNALYEFNTLPIIIGGTDHTSLTNTIDFWENIGFDTINVSDSTSAELIKLASNAWIDLNISFAHDLAKICDQINVDVIEVIKAANTLKKGSSYVNILTPSIGVGGYCLTKDPIFLSNFAKNIGINLVITDIARQINDESPEYLFKKLLSVTDLISAKVLILGISYKANTGDIRSSPVIKFIDLLKSTRCEIKWFDPLVQELPKVKLFDSRISELDHSPDWGVVVIGANHDCIEQIKLENLLKLLKPNGIVVDGRKFYTKVEIEQLRNHGIQYVGVGR
jgi:nucleotide sugar dehydrogenase